ncbi:MAG: hypothetical protein KJ550_10820 [Proteobacteria bacterium]|nr:hypothetical protein [Desulfobacteraceae bacterium]MBU4013944.1 hypothetical protein [Pseudomonadota bacterium]MBU4015134.1 hypothetical protein [Patescibacteria group bacterium]MBU4067026.1 hypothetical protein [Pseudomonadota bacterium]MBU4319396.1 hypothetical protein [Pseudomonadota bacterium]
MIKDVLKEILPTTWSRLLVVMTILLVPFAIFLHEWLKKLGLQFETIAKPEIRLLLGLSVLCVFQFSILIHLLVYITSLNKKIAGGSGRSKETAVNIKKKLEKDRERILLAILKYPKVEDVEIAGILSIGTNIAAFHLEELRRSKFVKVARIMGSEWEGIQSRTEWSIDHLGRKYLVHHKLIKQKNT